MARKAVASTLAAVVLFTALVVADATVMTAQDNLASSAMVSHLESREALLEESLAGGVSLQLLAQVQGYVASHPADCALLPEYVGGITGAASASGDDGDLSGISYSLNATAAAAPLAVGSDNLTLIAPFAGGVPGDLDLRERLAVSETGGGGTVSLEKTETHTVNLPVEIDAASSICTNTLEVLAGALSLAPCNATLEQRAFEEVLPGLVQEAAAQGFALTASWGLGGAVCSASYSFTLVEPVAGVTEAFDWTVQGSGTIA